MGLADYRELKVHVLLRRAARILREAGWTQGVLRAADGALDIHGAILVAADANPRSLTALTFIEADALVPRLRESQVFGALTVLEALTGDLPRWNDDPGRTVNEVLRLLEGAANTIDIAVS